MTFELAELMGEEVASPWQAPKRAAAPSSSERVEVTPQFTRTGKIANLVDMLTSQGFVVGAKVQRKEKGAERVFVIKKIDSEASCGETMVELEVCLYQCLV